MKNDEKCKFQINDLRIFSVSCVTNLYAVMVYCGFLARSFRRILSTKSRLVLRNMKGTHPRVISFSKTILAAGAKSKTCSSSCQLLSENQSAVIGTRKLEARDRNILENVILKYQKKVSKIHLGTCSCHAGRRLGRISQKRRKVGSRTRHP